ncbi:translation initiation factor IF-2-like [Penaeus chinensis]|uniref:translation initiation factor IF-2-like n=1 Tax=Penaeus chinensis TaxID=139456 RepID=UPI001FB5B6B2|nr:translation initiation factor IF-2-like [Penaeus chinensis]
MPVDPGHHRLLHGRGSRPFALARYTPLASADDAGSTGSTPTHSPGVTPPGPARAPPGVHTEVRLSDGGRAATHLRPPARTPIQRPCTRHRGAGSGQSRYTKLGTLSEEDTPPGGGSGLLRAVASRGRGYEDLRCRGAGGDAPDSGDSSAQSSPRVSPRPSPRPSPRASPRISPRASPPNGRKRHSGILITSALARSGIKRLSRYVASRGRAGLGTDAPCGSGKAQGRLRARQDASGD